LQHAERERFHPKLAYYKNARREHIARALSDAYKTTGNSYKRLIAERGKRLAGMSASLTSHPALRFQKFRKNNLQLTTNSFVSYYDQII
jgi:hypothetical protein